MTSRPGTDAPPPAPVPRPALCGAGRLIDALGARDLDGVAANLSADARFRALLPGRVLDLEGRDGFRSVLGAWFADAGRWELTEAVIGEVGGKVHLRWRLRVTKPTLGPCIVEQQVYADAAPDGTLTDVALMCTGFRPDPT